MLKKKMCFTLVTYELVFVTEWFVKNNLKSDNFLEQSSGKRGAYILGTRLMLVNLCYAKPL